METEYAAVHCGWDGLLYGVGAVVNTLILFGDKKKALYYNSSSLLCGGNGDDRSVIYFP